MNAKTSSIKTKISKIYTKMSAGHPQTNLLSKKVISLEKQLGFLTKQTFSV